MTDLASATSIPRTISVQRIRAALSFTNISALYIFVFLFGLFSLWVPGTFLTSGVWRSLLDESALTALVAIAVTIPL
jgi:ribose transport system permease protein